MAKTIFYSLAALVRKILFCHSKIKFISSRHRVISSIYKCIFGKKPGVRNSVFRSYHSTFTISNTEYQARYALKTIRNKKVFISHLKIANDSISRKLIQLGNYSIDFYIYICNMNMRKDLSPKVASIFPFGGANKL